MVNLYSARNGHLLGKQSKVLILGLVLVDDEIQFSGPVCRRWIYH